MAEPGTSHLVDYEQLFSWQARNLKNSILAEMFQKFNLTNDAIILHAGLPPAESFPLLSLTATTSFASPQAPSTATTPTQQPANLALLEAQQQDGATQAPLMQISVTGKMMQDAQQYMFHAGHPPLLRWARDMAATQHRPPNPVDCAMSSGAVDALTAAVSCLLDAGDYILCEEFTYPHAPQCTFIPRQLNMLPVAMDEQGMRPDSLRRVLETTPPSPVTGRPPRVIYIIPAGQNPTGAIMPVERKQEIYQICREHQIIILEDDAYYWLQYPLGGSVPEAQQPGLQLPASFLSMDTDSRVLRIDTFAKLLGPGFRLGWITGAPKLVSKVGHAIQAGTCGPCSLSQVLVCSLLEGWGKAGFEAFLKQQQALYARRADAVHAAASRHLRGLASWEEPRAGMFMWFKLTDLADVDERFLQQLVVQRVAIVPGRPFWADLAAQRAGAPCPYFRVAFSCVPEDRIDEAFSRLAGAIRAAMAAGPATASGVPLLLPVVGGSVGMLAAVPYEMVGGDGTVWVEEDLEVMAARGAAEAAAAAQAAAEAAQAGAGAEPAGVTTTVVNTMPASPGSPAAAGMGGVAVEDDSAASSPTCPCRASVHDTDVEGVVSIKAASVDELPAGEDLLGVKFQGGAAEKLLPAFISSGGASEKLLPDCFSSRPVLGMKSLSTKSLLLDDAGAALVGVGKDRRPRGSMSEGSGSSSPAEMVEGVEIVEGRG